MGLADIVKRIYDKVLANREAVALQEARSEGVLGPTDTPIERDTTSTPHDDATVKTVRPEVKDILEHSD